MAFARPTRQELIDRAKADIVSRLPDADVNLRGAPEEVLAIAEAGLTHGLHGHLVWLSKQLLADLAEDEFLLRIADIYGVPRTPAVKAILSLTLTGTGTSVCPAGTVWQTTTGVRYTQNADATISGGTATAAVTAAVGGADGTQPAGVHLQLAAPVAGISSTATVVSTTTTGVDLETIEHLRARVLLRLQTPPSGGGPGDYVRWALEVAGVTRAWEYANLDGPGTVGVRFVMDNKVGTIIPDAGEVAAVQAHIDALKPLTAAATVYAPIGQALDFTLHLVPDTSATRAAAQAALAALLRTEPQPNGTLLLSAIREAISLADGVTDYALTSPAADVITTGGHLLTMGAIAWV